MKNITTILVKEKSTDKSLGSNSRAVCLLGSICLFLISSGLVLIFWGIGSCLYVSVVQANKAEALGMYVDYEKCPVCLNWTEYHTIADTDGYPVLESTCPKCGFVYKSLGIKLKGVNNVRA